MVSLSQSYTFGVDLCDFVAEKFERQLFDGVLRAILGVEYPSRLSIGYCVILAGGLVD